MSILPINPSQLNESAHSAEATPAFDWRGVVAGLLSALVPGTGQLLIRQNRRGFVLLILLVAVLFCFWPFRVLRYYWALVVLFWSWIGLYIYASCSAALSRYGSQRHRSKLWLLLIVPVAFVTLSIVGAIVTRAAGFRIFGIPSTSMEPAVRRGDHVVADMHYYRSHKPRRQDMIIFRNGGILLIKRVVAMSGDFVSGKNGVIYVNGQPLDEPYIEHIGQPPTWMTEFGPISVTPNKYFVMGDNRDVSWDSRSPQVGLIDSTAIEGRPLYVLESDRTGATLR